MRLTSPPGALWLFLILLCGSAAPAWAQGGFVDPSFSPGAMPNGTVYDMLVQGDGRIVVAGSFASVGSVTRNRIARLNGDGTLDSTFDPGTGPNSIVRRVVLQGDGKMLIAGLFTTVGLTARSGLARLNSDGTLDTAFNAGSAGSYVNAITIQTDGKILVGGTFHSFNGDFTRGGIVRLNSDGTIDTTFAAVALGGGDQNLESVCLQSDAKILIGGNFATVNGTARKAVARLNANGSLDATFDAGTGPGARVTKLLLQSDGKPLAVGSYIGGTAATSRSGLFRLTATGTLDATFDAGTGPNSGSPLVTLAAGDRAVLAGAFTLINGLSRSKVARLNTDGTVDPLFDAGTAVSNAGAVAVQSDGRILVAGSSTPILRLLAPGTLPPPGAAPVLSSMSDGTGVRLMWSDVTHEEGCSLDRSPNGTGSWSPVVTTSGERVRRFYNGGLASGATYFYRIRAFNRFGNGAVSAPFAATTLNGVWPGQIALNLDPALGGIAQSGGGGACVAQPDGKLIVAVSYQENAGVTARAVIARFNPDGSLDRLFDAVSDYFEIYSLLLQPDGKLVAGGRFKVANGTIQRTVARFNSDGTEDSTFSASVSSGPVFSIARQADGKLIIGGYFTLVNGTARNCIARLNTDGSLDTAFDPGTGVTGSVNSLALDSAGRVVIGGSFYQVNGATFGNVARLNSNGSLDATFTANPGANNSVKSLAVQSDNRIVIAGSFTTYNSATSNHVARLNVNGTLDGSFSVGTGASDITALFLQADGRVIVSGSFSQIGGSARGNVARLTNVGTVDPTFDTVGSASFNSFCTAPDGSVVATGNATFDNGASQIGLARFIIAGGNPPPPRPLNVSVTTVNASQLSVTWTDVAGETGYIIERTLTGTGNWAQAGQSGADIATFTDSSLAEGTQYSYRVRSVNAQGASSASDFASAYTMLLPIVPTGFTVRAHGYSDVILTWKNAGNTSSFVIERSANGTGGWTPVASPVSDGAFRDSSLVAQTGYFYRIRALNSGGDSVSTSVAGATTAAAGWMPAGSLDPTFTPGTGLERTPDQIYSAGVNSILLQGDGKLIVCGQFGKFAGLPRKNIARINPDGSIDPSFDPGAWNCEYATAAVLQTNGKILVGGSFIGTDGYSHPNVRRLNSDGTVDPTFDATAAMTAAQYNAFYYGLLSLALQADGKVLAAGSSVIRLNTDGSNDTAFTAQVTGTFGATPWVYAMIAMPDGHVMISGVFEAINGTDRRNIARLDGDGSVDTSFDATLPYSYSGGIAAIAVQANGKVLRGMGQYDSGGIARHDTNGSSDPSFTPPGLGYAEQISRIAIQADGKMIIAGNFTTVAGVQRGNIARLNSDGSLDLTFDPGLGVAGSAAALAIQPDGRILVGGGFATVDDRPRNCIARLLGDPVTWNPIQRWKISFAISPIAPDSSDLDLDGVPTLLEYALGGNPVSADFALLPVPSISAGKFTLSYARLRLDLQYVVETSSDLIAWTTDGVDQGGVGPNPVASVPLNGGAQFLRLRVTLP